MKIANSKEAMESAGLRSNGAIDTAEQQHRDRVEAMLKQVEQFFDLLCPNMSGAEIHVFVNERVAEQRAHDALWAFACGLCVRADIPYVSAQAVTFKVFQVDQLGPLDITFSDWSVMYALSNARGMSCKVSVGGDSFIMNAKLGNCAVLTKMLVYLTLEGNSPDVTAMSQNTATA